MKRYKAPAHDTDLEINRKALDIVLDKAGVNPASDFYKANVPHTPLHKVVNTMCKGMGTSLKQMVLEIEKIPEEQKDENASKTDAVYASFHQKLSNQSLDNRQLMRIGKYLHPDNRLEALEESAQIYFWRKGHVKGTKEYFAAAYGNLYNKKLEEIFFDPQTEVDLKPFECAKLLLSHVLETRGLELKPSAMAFSDFSIMIGAIARVLQVNMDALMKGIHYGPERLVDSNKRLLQNARYTEHELEVLGNNIADSAKEKKVNKEKLQVGLGSVLSESDGSAKQEIINLLASCRETKSARKDK